MLKSASEYDSYRGPGLERAAFMLFFNILLESESNMIKPGAILVFI